MISRRRLFSFFAGAVAALWASRPTSAPAHERHERYLERWKRDPLFKAALRRGCPSCGYPFGIKIPRSDLLSCSSFAVTGAGEVVALDFRSADLVQISEWKLTADQAEESRRRWIPYHNSICELGGHS